MNQITHSVIRTIFEFNIAMKMKFNVSFGNLVSFVGIKYRIKLIVWLYKRKSSPRPIILNVCSDDASCIKCILPAAVAEETFTALVKKLSLLRAR